MLAPCQKEFTLGALRSGCKHLLCRAVLLVRERSVGYAPCGKGLPQLPPSPLLLETSGLQQSPLP